MQLAVPKVSIDIGALHPSVAAVEHGHFRPIGGDTDSRAPFVVRPANGNTKQRVRVPPNDFSPGNGMAVRVYHLYAELNVLPRGPVLRFAVKVDLDTLMGSVPATKSYTCVSQ